MRCRRAPDRSDKSAGSRPTPPAHSAVHASATSNSRCNRPVPTPSWSRAIRHAPADVPIVDLRSRSPIAQTNASPFPLLVKGSGDFDNFFLGFAHRFSNPFRPIALAASHESLRLGLFFYHDPGSFLLDLLIRDFLIAMGASHPCTQAKFVSEYARRSPFAFSPSAKAADASAFRPSTQVDRRHLRFLVPVHQPRGAPTELVRHIEQILGQFVRRHARQQHAADAQVEFGTMLFCDQCISRLLDPFMQELVGG